MIFWDLSWEGTEFCYSSALFLVSSCGIHNQVSFTLHSNEKAKDAMFYSYNKNINGFAAILEEEEAAEIASEESTSCFHVSTLYLFLIFVIISTTAFAFQNRASKCYISFLEQGKETAHNPVMAFP